MNHLEAWDKFYKIYPFRNGKKLRIQEARLKFFKLKVKDLPLILRATENYIRDKDVRANIGIRDLHRYIKDGKGIEIWREYLYETLKKPKEPEESTEQIKVRHKDIKSRWSNEGQTATRKKIADAFGKGK